MAIKHNKCSFDDDCFRLKICSLNLKDLRSSPLGFTSVNSMSGQINMIKMDFEYPTQNLATVQSWPSSISQGCHGGRKLDRLIPRKLNSEGIGRIRYLLTRARS